MSLEPQTFGFPLDSCPDVLPVSHVDLDTSSPFFNYIQYVYIVVVINFLKLLKLDGSIENEDLENEDLRKPV